MNILLMTDKLITGGAESYFVNWKVICVMMILRFIQQVMENYMNLLLEKKILYYLVDGII